MRIMRLCDSKLAESNPTKEMYDWFEKRTNKHIDLVKKYASKLADKNKDIAKELIDSSSKHDSSKFEAPEFLPYVYVSWQYHMKDLGEHFNPPGNIKDDMAEATSHHVKTNQHHPECHSDVEQEVINREDRDAIPAEMIDATKMPVIDIAEMVCDWCAMSEEKGTNTPREWADKNVNKRWKFSDSQVDHIYRFIDDIW